MTRVCVIPARGGSKRIPRKNVRLFAGRPMVSYAIEAAKASGLFDRILVSTDDAEIKRVSEEWGAEAPFVRPASLSDDHATTADVMVHAVATLEKIGTLAEEVCCIYPCVPFLQTEDLRRSLDLLIQGDACFAFPVAAFPSPIQRALRMDADGRTHPFHPQYENTRTQDLETAYHDAGQFYWGRKQAWLDGLPIHSHGIGLAISHWRVVDIDTPEDWDRAELFWRMQKDRHGAA